MAPATRKAIEEPADPPRARLGVLFVHGIGLQPRGRTLDEFGSPVVEWLVGWYDGLHRQWADAGLRIDDVEAWLAARPDADPRRVDAVRSLLDVTPVRTGGKPVDPAALEGRPGETLAVAVRVTDATGREAGTDEPPHARVDFARVRVDGAIAPSTWLLAESWWAEAFAPPTFGDLARWGIGVLPRTIGSHLGVRVHRAWAAWKAAPDACASARLIGGTAALLAGMLASLFVLVVLALVLVLGLLPVPRLRAALVSVQQRLAAVLGDSYVLVAQPFQAAAMVERVRRDLAWLCESCDSVAVVAHSQGGAIVNEVLRLELAAGDGGALGSARRGRVELLATFGSGLRKLDELRRLRGAARRLRQSASLTLLGLVLLLFAVFGAVLLVLDPARDASDTALWTVPYAIAGGVLVVAGTADLLGRPSGELEWWIGKLRATGVRWVDYAATADPVPNGRLLDATREFPQHVAVRNRGSLLRDHTTYWSNRDEFVADLVRRLAALDPAAADLTENAAVLCTAKRHRRARVAWLAASRRIALAAVAVALVRSRDEWLPLVRLAGPAVRRDDLPPVDLPAANGPFGAAVAVVVAYAAAALAWRALDRDDTTWLLSRGRRRPGGGEGAFLAACAALAVAAFWAVVPLDVTRWHALAGVLALVVLGVAYRRRAPAAVAASDTSAEPRTWAQRAGSVLMALAAAGVVAIATFALVSPRLGSWAAAMSLIAVVVVLASRYR